MLLSRKTKHFKLATTIRCVWHVAVCVIIVIEHMSAAWEPTNTLSKCCILIGAMQYQTIWNRPIRSLLHKRPCIYSKRRNNYTLLVIAYICCNCDVIIGWVIPPTQGVNFNQPRLRLLLKARDKKEDFPLFVRYSQWSRMATITHHYCVIIKGKGSKVKGNNDESRILSIIQGWRCTIICPPSVIGQCVLWHHNSNNTLLWYSATKQAHTSLSVIAWRWARVVRIPPSAVCVLWRERECVGVRTTTNASSAFLSKHRYTKIATNKKANVFNWFVGSKNSQKAEP